MYAKVQGDRKALQKHKNFRILYIKDEIVIKQEAYAYFRIEITLKTWYNIFG